MSWCVIAMKFNLTFDIQDSNTFTKPPHPTPYVKHKLYGNEQYVSASAVPSKYSIYIYIILITLNGPYRYLYFQEVQILCPATISKAMHGHLLGNRLHHQFGALSFFPQCAAKNRFQWRIKNVKSQRVHL